MFSNTGENLLPSIINTNDDYHTEKVYVDWPEENSEDYRFVSSRMEDVESDLHPIIAAEDIKKGVDITRNITDLKISSKPPIQENKNKRYEDLSHRQQTRHKNSSIPPLDLISQHSSIEIPGAKGAIDIDLRSTSDSMSEEYDDEEENTGIDNDSLDDNHDQYIHHNSDIYRTTLPRVAHEELIINPGEYNSSRYSNNNGISRRFSEITLGSQYRAVAPIEPNYSQYESANQNAKDFEKVAFEAVQQRFKHTIPSVAQDHTSSATTGTHGEANSSSKVHKNKPTLHVAPQIKQPLNEKAPNFIELNRTSLTQQKQINQTSYSNKFADKQRKESPIRTMKKSAPSKETTLPTHHFADKVDRNAPLSTQDYWNRRERSIERLTGEHKDHREEAQDQGQRPIIAQPHSNVFYAFNQYGEPLMISTSDSAFQNTSMGNVPRPQEIRHPHAVHPSMPDCYSKEDNASLSPRAQRMTNLVQDVRRSLDSDHHFQDAPFRRQPTLYDEKLLEKKTRIVSSERMGSHLPALPSSSDSNLSQNMGNSYSASLRKKDVSYEQYTLRDFKNIKQINSVGGLGPNLGSESHKQMKEKLVRQKNYSKAVKEKNQELLKTRAREESSPVLKVEDISHRENEEAVQTDSYLYSSDQEVAIRTERQLDDRAEKPLSKSTFSSANSKVREQAAKRDAMINYAKTVKEKQLKRQISKNKVAGSQTELSKKGSDELKNTLELFNNSDLDRLLQRHDYDKRITDQIRQKWEKIN